MTKHALPAVLLALAACGGSGTEPSNPADPSPTVFGAYAVTVALQRNDCDGTPTVLPQPTTVRQTPGAATFTLTHGGLSLAGAVARDGLYTTTPIAVADPFGPATLEAAGRFSRTGIDGTVTVTVTARCRYVVAWTGRNTSRANVVD